MSDKFFGVKSINLIGYSGVPSIDSPNNLNVNANIVAISSDVTISGSINSNVKIGSSYSLGIGTTVLSSKLYVNGNTFIAGILTATNYGLNTQENFFSNDGNLFITNESYNNVSIGKSSGYNLSTGSNNNFLGKYSGSSNTTGSNNNFFGRCAGYYEANNKRKAHHVVFCDDAGSDPANCSAIFAKSC